MDPLKKYYFEQVQKWNENLDVIFDKESEYNVAIIKKYKIILDELKDQLRLYFYTNNYVIIEQPSFMEAKFKNGLLLVRVEFPEIFPYSQYKFRLSIVEDSRREFMIYIIPNINQLYIPKMSNIRNRPKDSIQLNKSISNLENEFIFLDDKIKEINQITFHYCYHSSQKRQNKIEELKNYNDFLTILIKLLSN